jgi:hypothetical protein
MAAFDFALELWLLLLQRLGNVTRANAAGADLDAAHSTVVNGFYFLQVRMPGSAGFVVCMADIIAETGAFSTYFANS